MMLGMGSRLLFHRRGGRKCMIVRRGVIIRVSVGGGGR